MGAIKKPLPAKEQITAVISDGEIIPRQVSDAVRR